MPRTGVDSSSEEQCATASSLLTFTSNFPVPAPMKITGDRKGHWEFFSQQWNDYELATGLDKRSEKVRLATLRSVMGKECLQIFLNLNLNEADRESVAASLTALEAYFKPKTSVVYERYRFNMATQGQEEGIEEFVNRLRKLAVTCRFYTPTDEMIRDRIIIGRRDQTPNFVY